jgi:uncharacterized protein YbjT (DUF2867 family)
MRIAVIGGTGLVGHLTVEALRRATHEAVVVARSTGVDVTTGVGLDEALAGADAVIDVSSTPATDPDETKAFFGAVTEHLLAAEQRQGVGHHVLLSIVGLDRVEGNAHYAGKRHQEALVSSGAVPFTILRATQFFEFAEMVVRWTRQGDTAVVPPLLVQPVAAGDVADVLAEVVTGEPVGGITELAGPDPQDLVDMTRRTLAARGQSLRLVPSWRDGPLGVDMAGEVLLPEAAVRRGPTTFDSWLITLGPGSQPRLAGTDR